MITHAREDVPLQTWLNRNINKKVIEKFRDALEVCVSIILVIQIVDSVHGSCSRLGSHRPLSPYGEGYMDSQPGT